LTTCRANAMSRGTQTDFVPAREQAPGEGGDFFTAQIERFSEKFFADLEHELPPLFALAFDLEQFSRGGALDPVHAARVFSLGELAQPEQISGAVAAAGVASVTGGVARGLGRLDAREAPA